MTMKFGSLERALTVSPEHVFIDEERHLFAAAKRHLRCARLLEMEQELIAECDFHVVMAVECVFKHLFCLVRFSAGVSAEAQGPFAEVKRAREYGHDVKALGAFLIDSLPADERKELEPLILLLDAGTAWNEERYRSSVHSQGWFEKVQGKLALIDGLVAEIEDSHVG